MPSRLAHPPAGPSPPPIKQKRSQRTYDALVETGLRLLKDRDLDSIPVAEVAKAAGYSVGAFYARFNNKEEFLRALVDRYTVDRIAEFERLFAAAPDETLIDLYFEQQIHRLWTNRYFWRASLYRSFQDPTFWEPFRRVVRRVGDLYVERAARRIGRALTREEETNVRFAIQVANGAINNTMVNRPGPVNVDDPDFRTRLVRAFRAVSGWDELR
jgi:AcrR family transcriptional regulator